jgi:hypothetical protein
MLDLLDKEGELIQEVEEGRLTWMGRERHVAGRLKLLVGNMGGTTQARIKEGNGN